MDKMVVVGFEHPVEQTSAEVLGLTVEVGPWELQAVACTGHEVSYEVTLNTVMGQEVVTAGVGQGVA